MKRFKYIILVIFLFGAGYNLIAQQIPGSQYFYLGNGMAFFPLGGSGVSHFMSMESNLYNPAAFAEEVPREVKGFATPGGNCLSKALPRRLVPIEVPANPQS